ncbi:hypothetical protein [Williamsia muralis]|uniref:hypothetical protein n=1 Tax=Williamsia marianensis TaxID=85044 RepID=UPI001670D74A|nr:hypothetical protein [Williamsia marianensis]
MEFIESGGARRWVNSDTSVLGDTDTPRSSPAVMPWAAFIRWVLSPARHINVPLAQAL